MSKASKARYDLSGDAWRGSADGHSTVLRGPGYLYRAGHVLVEDEQWFTSTTVGRLREVSAKPHDELTAGFSQAGLPVLAFQVPEGVHVPSLINRLRQHEDDEATPNVGP